VILTNTCVFGGDAIKLGAKPSNKVFGLTYFGDAVLASATTASPNKQAKTALCAKQWDFASTALKTLHRANKERTSYLNRFSGMT
jgi:hypothetical protein